MAKLLGTHVTGPLVSYVPGLLKAHLAFLESL